MSNFKPRKIITTDTDLFLNLLADDTKIKEQPPQKMTVIKEDTSDDDEHVVDAVNLEGNNGNNLRFQQTEKNNSDRSGDDDDDDSRSGSYSDSYDSRSSGSSKSTKKSAKKEEVINNKYEIPFEQLPPQQQRLKRLEKFMQLKYIKEKFNISLSKEYTINSDYNEMCAEIEFHTNFQKRKNGIEFWKSTFVYGAKGVEYLNKSFDPFGFDLNGWSEHFSAIDANSNDDIFGELYDKYKSKFEGYSVELRAILMFAGSAGAFVTANSLSNVPGMNKIKENNPELFSKIKANVQNVTKSKINNMAPSNEKIKAAEQNMMYQKMMQEKRQMEQALEAQRQEMERMQENQQRLIEQQQSENNALKTKISMGGSGNNNTKSNQAPKSNLNSLLDKLKRNLPTNDETSSVTEENSSDRRVLRSSTVNSETRSNVKSSMKNKKSVLNIRR
jgi:hypothetical protein